MCWMCPAEIQFFHMDCKSDGIGHAQWAYDVEVVLNFLDIYIIRLPWNENNAWEWWDVIEWVTMVSLYLSLLVMKHHTTT